MAIFGLSSWRGNNSKSDEYQTHTEDAKQPIREPKWEELAKREINQNREYNL